MEAIIILWIEDFVLLRTSFHYYKQAKFLKYTFLNSFLGWKLNYSKFLRNLLVLGLNEKLKLKNIFNILKSKQFFLHSNDFFRKKKTFFKNFSAGYSASFVLDSSWLDFKSSTEKSQEFPKRAWNRFNHFFKKINFFPGQVVPPIFELLLAVPHTETMGA